MPDDRATLVDRLRGIYRTPITDGLGPAGGDEPDNPNEHVRRFKTPPIHHEAADEITRLRSWLECIEGNFGDAREGAQQALEGGSAPWSDTRMGEGKDDV